MTSVQYILSMRKLIRDWFRGQTYDAVDEKIYHRKCCYGVTNIRIENNHHPKLTFDIIIYSYHLHDGDGWVKLSKPNTRLLRNVNSKLRYIVGTSLPSDLRLFDITRPQYYITCGTIKWGLK